MTQEKLNEILAAHKLWLDDKGGGIRANLRGADLRWANLSVADLSRANLSGADLSGANLSGANLRGADLRWANLSVANLSRADLSRADLSWAGLSGADLRWANLSGADLSRADLSGADLSGANLSGANLRGADLRWANLSVANLSRADLSRADLRRADLRWANLSGADLMSSINFLEAHFERTTDGYIVYKCFGAQYKAPEKWEIKPGSVLEETVNPLRTCDCGSGINVAPLGWVRSHCNTRPIWKLLIRWEWLAGVVCPYNSDGKIRCERAELVEVVEP